MGQGVLRILTRHGALLANGGAAGPWLLEVGLWHASALAWRASLHALPLCLSSCLWTSMALHVLWKNRTLKVMVPLPWHELHLRLFRLAPGKLLQQLLLLLLLLRWGCTHSRSRQWTLKS